MEACFICSTNPSTKALGCGHFLCTECLFDIYKEQGICPYCREEITILPKKEGESIEYIPLSTDPFEKPTAHTKALEELQTQNQIYDKKIEDYKIQCHLFEEKQQRLVKLAKIGYEISRNDPIPKMPLVDFIRYRMHSTEDLPANFIEKKETVEIKGFVEAEERHVNIDLEMPAEERLVALQQNEDYRRQLFELGKRLKKVDLTENEMIQKGREYDLGAFFLNDYMILVCNSWSIIYRYENGMYKFIKKISVLSGDLYHFESLLIKIHNDCIEIFALKDGRTLLREKCPAFEKIGTLPNGNLVVKTATESLIFEPTL